MRTFFKGMILGLALLVGLGIMVAPKAEAAYYHYTMYVYANEGFSTATGGYTKLTSGITYQILTAGSDTEATLYSDSGITSMTNPVTTTVFDAATKIDFYTDATSCDVIIVNTAGGFTTVLDGATTNTRTVIIDQRPNMMHHGMIWWKLTTSSTEQDTGIDFNKYTAIHNVILEVVTVASSNEKVDIGVGAAGTGEDTDGFFDDAPLATAGWFNLKEANDAAMGLSSGGTTVYFFADNMLGALLGTTVVGSGGTTESQGHRLMWDYTVTTIALNDLCYVFPLLGGSTGDGYIHWFMTPTRPH